MMLHVCVPSFISMRKCSVRKFEEWRNSSKENCLRLFQTICNRHGNMWLSWKQYNRHTHQASSLCVLPLESLRSEEEKCLRLFYLQSCVVVILMLAIEYTLCIQTFVHIALTNCELHWHVYAHCQLSIALGNFDCLHIWLWICTFLQNFMAFFFSVFELCW